MATTVARTNGKQAATKNVVEAATKASAKDAPLIEIDYIGEETIRVPIIGTTPLIVHRFSEKNKRKMLDGMQGKKTPKQNKDPQAEYEAALYRLGDGRFGLPAAAFKQATVGAARFYGKDVTMTSLKQFVFVRGEFGSDGRSLVAINGKPKMREDPVKLGRSGADLRYRPEFWPWSAVLEVTFFPSVIARGSVLALIDAGGLGVGVGEWRPEKDGEFGCYRIDTKRRVEVAR